MVTVEVITRDNIHAVLALEVAETQKPTYPCSNALSIAEGLFPPDDDPVWMRAICNDGEPVGFMMTSEVPDDGEYFLWRMMIDERHQGRGYGSEAMQLLIERVKDSGNPRLIILTHLKSNAAAGRFYESVGFSYTGNELNGGDLEMSRRFD